MKTIGKYIVDGSRSAAVFTPRQIFIGVARKRLYDMNFLERLLMDKEEELQRARVVYLKPWPGAEESCERLLQQVRAWQGVLRKELYDAVHDGDAGESGVSHENG
jgi:hypothetical protein